MLKEDENPGSAEEKCSNLEYCTTMHAHMWFSKIRGRESSITSSTASFFSAPSFASSFVSVDSNLPAGKPRNLFSRILSSLTAKFTKSEQHQKHKEEQHPTSCFKESVIDNQSLKRDSIWSRNSNTFLLRPRTKPRKVDRKANKKYCSKAVMKICLKKSINGSSDDYRGKTPDMITFQEFREGCAEFNLSEAHARRAFDQFDVEESGRISAKELRIWKKYKAQQANRKRAKWEDITIEDCSSPNP